MGWPEKIAYSLAPVSCHVSISKTEVSVYLNSVALCKAKGVHCLSLYDGNIGFVEGA